MEGLALFVWLALAVGTFAGAASERRGPRPDDGFPAVPVPAGNSLSEARQPLGKGLFPDPQIARPQEPACTDCSGRDPDTELLSEGPDFAVVRIWPP